MGGRSTSAATPHTKRRCRRDRVATFPVGPDGAGGQQAWATPVTQPAPATGLAALGLTDSAVHALAVALQGVVASGISAALPSPSPSGLTGKVATLYLLHIRCACGVAVDVDPPPFGSWSPGDEERWRGYPPLTRP